MLDFTTLKDSILNNVYINDTNTYRKFDNTGAATGANTSGDIVEAITLRTANVSTRDIEDAKIETNGGDVGEITYVPFNSSKYNKITDKYDYDSINERLTNNGFRELETYKRQLRDEDYVVQYGGSNINNIYYLKRDEVDNDLVAGSNLSIEALKQIQDIKDVLGGYVGANIEGSTAKINYIKETDNAFSDVLTGTQKLTRQAAKRGQDIKDFLGGDFGGSNYIIQSDDAFKNKLTGTEKLTRQAAQRGQDIKDFDGGDFGGIKYVNNRSAHTNRTDINNFEVSYDYGNRLSYLKYTENTLTETLTRNELISLRNAKETTMTTNRTTYWTSNNIEATISEWNVDNDQNGSNFLEGSFPDAFNIVQPSHNYDSQQVSDPPP